MITYVISNGKGIYAAQTKDDRYVPVGDFKSAVQFDSYNKAKNILKSNLGKGFGRKFHVEEIMLDDNGDKIIPMKKPIPIAKPEEVTPCKTISKRFRVLLEEPDVDSHVNDIHESVNDLIGKVSKLASQKEQILNRISTVDQEISDLEHFIEFSDKLNVYEGWLVYKLLKKRLQERRIKKDELYFINTAGETFESLERMGKILEGMDGRKYTPRILTEIFKDEGEKVKVGNTA